MAFRRDADLSATGSAPATGADARDLDAPMLCDASVDRDLAALALAPPRRQALGLFLRHLACGERLAQRATAGQAAIAPDRHAARFHRAQARHEAMHARLFDLFARALGAPMLSSAADPYARYASHLAAATTRGDYVDTLLGTQVVLEALGDALLERLDQGLERHGAGFRRLRRMLRAQEAAHHAFGVARLAPLAARCDRVPALRDVAQAYLALADALIAAGAPVLRHFELAPAEVGADMRARLPPWLAGTA